MDLYPNPRRPGSEAEDLTAFLEHCRRRATADTPTLASVSLAVRHIDPLAVLLRSRRPNEPHHYRECPAEDVAVAALDAVCARTFRGKNRFAEAGLAAREMFSRAVAAGDAAHAFAGPHAFLLAPFGDDAPLTLFIPRRMVARRAGEHTATANALISPDSDPAAEAARMLTAHGRFAAFDYGAPDALAAEGDEPDFRDGEPAYAARVDAALDAIRTGRVTKLVPAREERLRRPGGFDTARALERLRAGHPASHTFSFSAGDGAEWIGATPETLLRVSGNRLHTESLAGTGARARSAGEDARLESELLHDEKISREQRAVTDEIVARLRELGLEPELPSSPRILRLPLARHLLTPVSATLAPGRDAAMIAGALHPTPAVAGAPRDAALAELARTETFSRDHFAGVSGWLAPSGDAHFTVNLRCAEIRGDEARLFAGAGVIAGSDPASEVAETALKLRTIAEALR